MDWLMHNYIADMRGPDFLVLYACVIAATLAWCWWKLRATDPTLALPPLALAANPDPYEIAYLRAGENEVARVAMFDLIQRGYLRVVENKKWWGGKEQRMGPASNHPDPRHLSTLEHKLFDFFSTPRPPGDIFQSGSLSPDLKALCGDCDTRLREQQMLSPSEVGETQVRVALVGVFIIVVLGGYKLIVALAKGRHNVGFLVAMALVSIIVLVFLCRPPRQSPLGKDYLKRLQEAFERLKPTGAAPDLTDTTLLLLVALFGVGVLTETSYAYFYTMFKQSVAGDGIWSAGCGGGCGGGGCGGGGCGGCGGG